MTARSNGFPQSAPDWEPLVKRLGQQGASAFMWMYSSEGPEGTLQHYKHIETRGYLTLDSEGDAWTETWGRTDFATALKKVLTT